MDNLYFSTKNKSLEDILDNIGEAIVVADKDMTINTANKKFAAFYGLTPEQLVGRHPFELYPDFKKSVFFEGIIKTVETGKSTTRVGFSSNSKKWLVIRSYKYDDDNYVMVVNELNDVQDKTAYIEKYDTLTSLPNRYSFEEDLSNIIKYNPNFGVIILDINRFHELNETAGYNGGDMCLMEVAARLKRNSFRDNRIYKISSDQFLVVCMQPKKQCLEEIENIFNSFEQPFNVDKKDYFLNATAGVFYWDKQINDIEISASNAFKKVELALVQAKKSKLKYMEFSEDMEKDVNNFQVEKELREALKNNEFELFYQAQADLLTKEVGGVEVLIRWKKPNTTTYIPPMSFLPLAEQIGLMPEIDKWVVETAMRQLSELKEVGLDLPVSINLSGFSICNENTIDFFDQCMKKYSISGDMLVVEITETSLMSDIEKSKHVISALKDKGIKIAIDDFGTGYSSMEYLLKYPANYLKIDREFVKNMEQSNMHRVMIHNIIKLGHSLGMAIIAEGAENDIEMKLLKDFDCEFVQGFGYSKPLSFENFKLFVKEKGISDAKSIIR